MGAAACPRTPWRGWWPALLLGLVLAAVPGRLHPAPDDPPAGFVWENLKEIHARIARPETWFARCGIRGAPPFKDLQGGTGGKPPYEFSAQRFDGFGLEAGLWVSANSKVNATFGKPAGKYAAEMQAEMVGKNEILQSWTRPGMPSKECTAHAVFFLNKEGGEPNCMFESVFIVNEAADTCYIITVKAPRNQWKEIEAVGETMLANLRLDPKF